MEQVLYKQKANRYFWRRMLWYILGFVMFFAPFAFFTKAVAFVLGKLANPNIHNSCFRIPIQNIFTGNFSEIPLLEGVLLFLLVLVAFLFGPFFCGKLCPTGGFSELVSRFLPRKFQINWPKHVDPVPIRYGFLIGVIVVPLITENMICAFCGYWFFEVMVGSGLGIWGELMPLYSSLILTGFFWLIIFGVFTKGGRGYCNFLCPVGPLQNFFYFLGRRFKWTYKLKLNATKCNNCGICADECPMSALEENSQGAAVQYNMHHCLTCLQCVNSCPQEALSYGRGEHGFVSHDTKKEYDNLAEPVLNTKSS
jgi:polyferredoxin